MPRPSGIAIVEHGSVAIAVAHVEMRGRLNILPRWRNRVAWLSAAEEDVEALMVFVEPGLVSIREWEVDGPRIQQRFTELAVSTDPDALHALRLILDRYQRLNIPATDRPSLGDAALAHLGLQVERGHKSLVYVTIFDDRIDIMSPAYRDAKLLDGHPLIEDLP
jgi:hypothetical protein